MTWDECRAMDRRRTETGRNRVLQYIKDYIGVHGYAPAQTEVIQALRMSGGTVNKHFKALFDAGEIETDLPDTYQQQRAYRLRRA